MIYKNLNRYLTKVNNGVQADPPPSIRPEECETDVSSSDRTSVRQMSLHQIGRV